MFSQIKENVCFLNKGVSVKALSTFSAGEVFTF